MKIESNQAHQNNFTKGRLNGTKPQYIILHVLEGYRPKDGSKYRYFTGANPKKVSAHFIVYRNGQVDQCVDIKDTAHHCRNWNYNSIGIELEGITKDPNNFTDEQYKSSAELVKYLCQEVNITIARSHIKGHSEMPGHTGNSDMGKYWYWQRLMDLMQ